MESGIKTTIGREALRTIDHPRKGESKPFIPIMIGLFLRWPMLGESVGGAGAGAMAETSEFENLVS
jgi:hypothetical protein